MDRGAGYRLWGHKESDTTDRMHMYTHIHTNAWLEIASYLW